MSRRRKKNKKGLSGKERNVYKQRRDIANRQQRLVEETQFDFESSSDVMNVVPIRSRNDFLPTAPCHEDASDYSRSRGEHQLTLPAHHRTSSTMRIQSDDVQPPSHPLIDRVPSPDSREMRTFTWQGYFSGCAWGSAAAATILAVLYIAV